MDALEKALLGMIKASGGVEKRSKKGPFDEMEVQGKRPSKVALGRALRSLERARKIRIRKHAYTTVYLPVVKTVRKGTTAGQVLDRHIDSVEIDLKWLRHCVDEISAESRNEVDEVLGAFSTALHKAVKPREDLQG